MKRLWNRYIRFMGSIFAKTGLEQDLNQGAISEELAVPEIVPQARQMAADGIVLLKNDHHTLPIRREDRVAVFGRSAVDYFTVGYGSGGDVAAPYRSNLMDGLKENGVTVHEALAKAYADWRARPANIPDEGYWGHWPMSNPEMKLPDGLVAQAAAESDLAVVVIGRAAGESRENVLKKGSFYLTNGERRLLRQVTAHFDRVCVVMDCGNVIDMGWTEEFGSRIGAIVYAWQGGMESGFALADVLTGKVDPSGKLTDTIARRYEDYPTCGHFGGRQYNNYVEDIYVGCRYFETFAKDKVLYPFGFGLSYTDFALEAHAQARQNQISVQVTVRNTGSLPGREVVQAYLTPPCGKLGNPARVLAAFQKTRLLQPGETEVLSLTVCLADFASYDDSGITGHKNAYVLESGDYTVSVGTDIRSALPALTVHKDELELVKQLTEMAAVQPERRFRRMKNQGGSLTYEDVPTAEKDLKAEILSRLPAPLQNTRRERVTFQDVLSGRATAAELVAQLSDQELDEITHGEGKMNSALGPAGNAGILGGVSERLRERGIPAVVTTDGPSGIRLRSACSLLPCGTALASTFDPEGVERLYALLGREMVLRGTDVLLGPGMNIHRDPLCGRNFEYYSEDPYLTGKIAAAAIRGIQSSGLSACPKHFACNNQETLRNKNDSRLSQRTLREIYLKGFEIAIREAKPLCLMSSYNKVNGVWSHYHYELCTGILREEWGYEGLVITDWWMQEGASREFPHIKNDACRIRAQVDVLMPGEIKNRTLVPSLSAPRGVTRAEAQRSAVHVISFILKLKKGDQ